MRRTFTLIQLLVVIAIITVLAAILFPVFARAREKARQATCQSNPRQIGLGFAQYTQDYDGDYPCDSADPYLWFGRHFRWPIMPYPGVNQKRDATNPADPWRAVSGSGPAILQGPSDASTAFDNTSYAYSAAFYHAPAQVAQMTTLPALYQLPVPGYPYAPTPQGEAAVAFPARKVLVSEWTDNHDGVSPPIGLWNDPVTHDTWREYLFADGHVRYLPSSRIQTAEDGFPDPTVTVGGVGGGDLL